MIKITGTATGYTIESDAGSLPVSEEDVLRLAQSARLIQDKIRQDSRRKGRPTPAFFVSVASAAVGTDSLKTAVHLELTDPEGNSTRFALTPELAHHIVERMPAKIAEVEAVHRPS